MTPQTALNNLYAASQLAPLPAKDHQELFKSFELLKDIINPKEEPKS